MDSKTKSAIKSLVLDLRHTLENELAIALRRYGIFTDRDWSLDAPPERLTNPADREIWRRIVTVIKQGMQEGRTLQEASQDYVRESAFTFLNRLVGLKCLEVRGIMHEVITTRDIYGGRSKAHRDYREEHPVEARAPDDALPACLESVWRLVNDELIGYLFDPDDDYTLVWPRYAVLKDCIAKINGLEEAAWAEDEIIGWIYQFYNAREKEAIRSRGKPQTPHDVAVINQFFTPRWIVKFLVDNTLGRLWLEMHPGSTRVRKKCDYLVPEPLADEDGEGDGGTEGKGEFQLDPDSPINNPQAEPRREEKPLPQIKLLDPACGTMHFGHYAMEIFDAMYRDARDWGHLQIEDREIPTVILENNLFGVDIDRRAVQLAALSLFMKARTMHPEARVRQVNLVAADATLPDSDVRERFLERYARTPKVQEAFAQVLDDMDQVAELGSLLRVEERLRELLSDVGHVDRKQDLKALDPRPQRDLPGLVLSGVEGSQPPVRQMGLADLADDEGQAAAWTPHYTLRELREDLRAFARRALDEHDLNAELFATEADKAVRLLDVLMASYDVVVMNPPYGSTTTSAKRTIKRMYPATKNDLYAAFFERALGLCTSRGYVGALTSRTFLYLTRFQGLREGILLERAAPMVFLDLGFGVLDDAFVETVASVTRATEVQPSSEAVPSIFVRAMAADDKEASLKLAASRLSRRCRENHVFIVHPLEFTLLPRSPFAYWASSSLRRLFAQLKPFDPTYGAVRQGKATGNDSRFLRQCWEIPEYRIGGRWRFFAKGGDYCKYYYDVDIVIDWAPEVRKLHAQMGNALPNQQHYFKEGLTYPLVTIKGLNVRHLRPGCVFGHKGPLILTEPGWDLWSALGVFNSEAIQAFVFMLTPSRSFEVGYVGAVPFLPPSEAEGRSLTQCARQSHDIKASWDTGNEICTRFTQPWLLQLAQPEGNAFAKGLCRVLEFLRDDAPEVEPSELVKLESLLDTIRAIEKAADVRLQALQSEIDETVYDLYDISTEDRRLIQRELGERPPELVWPEMEGKSDRHKREEHVKRFFYYFARQAVREDEDGIVPLAGCAGQEPYLMDRVRARLEETFGPATAYELEQEAAKYIGRDLEAQMHTYFFHHFHVDLYKKRPILWHLTSDKKTFAVMLDYHRLDRETLSRVRGRYLWPQMESVRTRLADARAQEAVATIAELEEELEDLKDFEERLESVIQGTVKVNLPKWANGPYRNGEPPYDPDLNDGVKVNLLPIQKARLLPVKSVL